MNGMDPSSLCRRTPARLRRWRAAAASPSAERCRADEVLLAIRRIGICGTDFHILEGLHPFLQYPRIMGHELSAEVLEARPGSGFAPGDPVIVLPYLSCGTCVACRKGKTNCCTTLACLGVHCDGGMAERIVLPEKNLLPAEGLSLDEAAMVEFLAIGAHAVRRSRLTPGDRALVVGAGPIGIGTALFAQIAGAEVTLMDRVPAILDLASRITGIGSNDRRRRAPPRARSRADRQATASTWSSTPRATPPRWRRASTTRRAARPMSWSAW